VDLAGLSRIFSPKLFMIRQKMVFDNDVLDVRRCRAYSEVQSMPEKVTTFPARQK